MEVDSRGETNMFKLSAVLSGHTSDVRAVLLPNPSFALTASRDGSTKVWKRISESPPTYDPTESSHGAHFKTCLAYATPSKEYPDGLIISSGQDALIEARQPAADAEKNADGFMVGHSNQVCSLDVCSSGGWIVSGSWDSSARIWQIGRWETEVELDGHTASVWAVLAYDETTVVTGCADQAIRVFDIRGKLQRSFDGQNIVRALTRLPSGHSTGGEIASASNDGVIRIWTLKGSLVAELYGHESFIYSLAVLPSGEIVSAGEDRTVRIWKGMECIQVITLPAISIWSVAANSNGDIIVGSSDKVARIFTREQSRVADEVVLSQFDQEVQTSSVPKQQVGDINMTDLPGPDWLQRKSGTKEGQSQIIKETDGGATLYQWSMSQQTWIKIGQVVDSTSGSSDKKTLNGKEYDYVFDIDIEDGKPALKLPFNVTQNPYDAATKFLNDNELPMTYLEETANFIIKNTQGATLGTQADTRDAWGTGNRYRPGEVSSYQPPAAAAPAPAPAPKQMLPQKEYLSIVLGKPTQAMTQITKKDLEYNMSGKTDMAIPEEDMENLASLAQQLQNYNFQGKPSMTLSSSITKSFASLILVATQWQPPANRLAGLDLLRFVAAAAKEFPSTEIDGVDVVAAVLGSGIFDPESIQANSKLAMIALRFFSNLLYGSPSGRALMEEHMDNILDSVKPVSKIAIADASVAVALTTFYLNLGVYITADKNSDPDLNAHRGLSIVEELAQLLNGFPAVNHAPSASPGAQTTEPTYRALVALGTVLVGLKNGEITSAAKDILGVPSMLGQLQKKKYLEEPRFKTVVAEIKTALK